MTPDKSSVLCHVHRLADFSQILAKELRLFAAQFVSLQGYSVFLTNDFPLYNRCCLRHGVLQIDFVQDDYVHC